MSNIYQYEQLSVRDNEILINEIKENPQQVNAHIESFRRWVLSMSHLKCPTDSKFLLKFLRTSKFDHKRAERRLDNFCTVRKSPRGSPDFFKSLSIDDPIIDYYLEAGMHLYLGQVNSGEIILLVRTKMWDPEKIPFPKLIALIMMAMDIIMSDENSQIYGFKMIIDLLDSSRKSMESWSDPKAMKQMNRVMQESYPIRMKGTIFYNEPVIFDIVFQIFSFFLNEKMKSRTLRVKNDINKAIEKIPGLDKILPTEYNGQGGSIKECSERWKAKFKAFYKNGHPMDGISVDENKRPKETASYLVEYADYKGQTLGTEGTFTKFENVF